MTTTSGVSEPRPIPVHLASVAAELGLAAAPGPPSPGSPKTTKTVYRTVQLTASDPVQEIMAASDERIIAWVVAVDADVVLADNKSDAAAVRGSYVPCVTPAAGKPNLAAPYPVQDNRVVYVGPVAAIGAGNVLRVSVSAIYRN